MGGKNTESRLEKTVIEYLRKFGGEAPTYVMCMGDDTYCELLEKAIKRGTPLTDEDYDEIECDIIY